MDVDVNTLVGGNDAIAYDIHYLDRDGCPLFEHLLNILFVLQCFYVAGGEHDLLAGIGTANATNIDFNFLVIPYGFIQIIVRAFLQLADGDLSL